ncbi:MAG: hypothetical protein ACK4V6_10520 [Microthrixaceae bacterium]
MTTWDGDELDALRERLIESRHITRLSGGPAGTVAAYLPGRRIPGLRVTDDDQVEVHVVMHVDSTVSEVEAAVAEAFGDRHRPAALFIDDVDSNDDPPAERELTEGHASTR